MPWSAIVARVVTALFVLISCAAPACDTVCALRADGIAHCTGTAEHAMAHMAMSHTCMAGMHRAVEQTMQSAVRGTHVHVGCGHEAPAVLKSFAGLHPPQVAALLAAPGEKHIGSGVRVAEAGGILRSRLRHNGSDVLRI